jgi:hypothetical protein
VLRPATRRAHRRLHVAATPKLTAKMLVHGVLERPRNDGEVATPSARDIEKSSRAQAVAR